MAARAAARHGAHEDDASGPWLGRVVAVKRHVDYVGSKINKDLTEVKEDLKLDIDDLRGGMRHMEQMLVRGHQFGSHLPR